MDTTKDTTMQLATDAVIEELRMLAEDLYVNGYNRYSSAMSKAADELERLRVKVEEKQARIERLEEEESKQAALLDCLNEWKALAKSAEKERDVLRAKIEQMERQEPVGVLHDDGYFVWRERPHPYQGNYAGWKMALYALPGAKGE